MPHFQTSDSSDGDSEGEIDQQQAGGGVDSASGRYNPASSGAHNSDFTQYKIDPYKGMLQLRELLRGGKITKAEYEAAKVDLLFDGE